MNNLILDNKNDYYTIKGDVIKKVSENSITIENCFDILKAPKNIVSYLLSTLEEPRLVILNDIKIKSAKFDWSGIAYVLIDFSKVESDNIKFDSKYQMMFSDDLLEWNFYYDDNTFNTTKLSKYDKNILIRNINYRCKSIDFINKKYNYVFLKLNKNDNLNCIYKTLVGNIIKVEDVTIDEDTINFVCHSKFIDLSMVEANTQTISSLNDIR